MTKNQTSKEISPEVRAFFSRNGKRSQDLERKKDPEAYRRERVERGRSGGLSKAKKYGHGTFKKKRI